VAVVAGLAGALLAWFRMRPGARATLWAEDGALFLAQASVEPWAQNVLAPYAGYLHTLPRLVADLVVAVVPTAWWAPTTTALSCALLGTAVAGVVLLTRGLAGLPARTALGLVTVCAPLLALEVVGNLANVHWLLLWLMPWMMLADGGGRVRRWALALATLLVVTTEIQALALAPLLLWRPRGRGVLPRLLAVAVGAALQVQANLSVPRGVAGSPPDLVGTLLAWLHVVVLPWVMGAERALTTGSGRFGTALGVATTVGVAAAALLVVVRGTRLQALVATTFPLVGVALWVVAVWVNHPQLRAEDGAYVGVRYGYVPSLLLVTPVVLALAVLPAGRIRRTCAVGAAVAAAVPLVVGFAPGNARAVGPAWQEQVRLAELRCHTLTPGTVVEVPITPEGWRSPLPCSSLG